MLNLQHFCRCCCAPRPSRRTCTTCPSRPASTASCTPPAPDTFASGRWLTPSRASSSRLAIYSHASIYTGSFLFSCVHLYREPSILMRLSIHLRHEVCPLLEDGWHLHGAQAPGELCLAPCPFLGRELSIISRLSIHLRHGPHPRLEDG